MSANPLLTFYMLCQIPYAVCRVAAKQSTPASLLFTPTTATPRALLVGTLRGKEEIKHSYVMPYNNAACSQDITRKLPMHPKMQLLRTWNENSSPAKNAGFSGHTRKLPAISRLAVKVQYKIYRGGVKAF
jgi:hypothetical protein